MPSSQAPDDAPTAADGPPTFTRPLRLSSSLIACLVGFACAIGSGVRLDLPGAVLTVLAVLLGHFGLSRIGAAQDKASGHGSSRPADIPQPAQASAISTYAPLALALLLALGLTWRTASLLPALVATGVLALGAWRASSPALRGSEEALATTCWLLITVTADGLQRGSFSPLAAAAGLSYALLATNQHLISAFATHTRDVASGRRTLVIMLSAATAKWLYLLIALFAYGWLVALVARYQLPQHAAAAALTLVFSFAAGRELLEHAEEAAYLGPAIRRTILAAHLHGLILAATLAFGRWPA